MGAPGALIIFTVTRGRRKARLRGEWFIMGQEKFKCLNYKVVKKIQREVRAYSAHSLIVQYIKTRFCRSIIKDCIGV